MVLGADPPLTSVDMCLEDIGRVAAEHLLLALSGEPTHGPHTVPCRLVTRGLNQARGAMNRPAASPSGGRPGAAPGGQLDLGCCQRSQSPRAPNRDPHSCI